MFTGIIEETGSLKKYTDRGGKRYLTITCSKVTRGLKTGDSVACNGACLTVTAFNSEQIEVEVMQETVQKTTVRWWRIGEAINLERALGLNGRLDGHFVQGHVDTVLHYQGQENSGDTVYLWFDLPQEQTNLVTWQGSVAINGVSLTVAKLEHSRFAVALISHTLQETNLGKLQEYVNVEFDIIGKYIVRFLQNREKPKITEGWLREKGF